MTSMFEAQPTQIQALEASKLRRSGCPCAADACTLILISNGKMINFRMPCFHKLFQQYVSRLVCGVTKRELHGSLLYKGPGTVYHLASPFPTNFCAFHITMHHLRMGMHLHHHQICPYLDLNQFSLLLPSSFFPCLCTLKDCSGFQAAHDPHFVKLNLGRVVTGFQPQRQKMRLPASHKNSDPDWYHHKSLDRGWWYLSVKPGTKVRHGDMHLWPFQI